MSEEEQPREEQPHHWEEIRREVPKGASPEEALKLGLVEAGQKLGDEALAGQITGAVIVTFQRDGEVAVSLLGMNQITALGALRVAQALVLRKVMS